MSNTRDFDEEAIWPPVKQVVEEVGTGRGGVGGFD
jgi:hypothetical protein